MTLSPGDARPASIPWWRSIRVRIAAAVAVVAVLVSGALGVVLVRQADIAARESLRDQALGRLLVAADGYRVDGRLRNEASIEPDFLPAQLRDALVVDRPQTWFDGQSMWAGERLGPSLVIGLRLDAAGLAEQSAQRTRALLLALLIAAFVSGPLGWAAATTVSRRLRRAAGAARAVAAGSEVTTHQGGSDEVAVLTRAVDDMAASLNRRLEQERAFTADVAHELRTPLTGLVSAAELLPDDAAGALVRAQVARLRTLVEDLLEISRLDAGTEPVDLVPIDLATAVRQAVTGSGLDATVEVVGSSDVLLDPRRLSRVLANLVGNAHRHGATPCTVTVAERALVVADDGPGFPEDVLNAGAQRFHGVGAHKGSGLGLTIAEKQAAAIGARLELDNAPDGGAQVRISWSPPDQGATG